MPGGPSIACSTAAAIEWDAAFKSRADQSGRAVAGVHDASCHEWSTPAAEAKEPPTASSTRAAVVKATAAEAATKRERDDAPLASAALR